MQADLRNNDLWWKGPQFLTSITNQYWCSNATAQVDNLPGLKVPKSFSFFEAEEEHIALQDENISLENDNDLEEALNNISPSVQSPVTREESEEFNTSSIIRRFTSFQDMIKNVAHANRTLYNFRHTEEPRDGQLTPEELHHAKVALIIIVQRESFHKELLRLQGGKNVLKNSSLRSLQPFLDTDGLIRVGGRLRPVIKITTRGIKSFCPQDIDSRVFCSKTFMKMRSILDHNQH